MKIGVTNITHVIVLIIFISWLAYRVISTVITEKNQGYLTLFAVWGIILLVEIILIVQGISSGWFWLIKDITILLIICGLVRALWKHRENNEKDPTN